MTGWTSPTHIILLLLIALLLFGAKRLPEIGHSLGKGMREFKKSVTGEDEQMPTPELTATAATPPPAEQTVVTATSTETDPV